MFTALMEQLPVRQYSKIRNVAVVKTISRKIANERFPRGSLDLAILPYVFIPTGVTFGFRSSENSQ